MTSSDSDVTTASMTSRAPAVSTQQPRDIAGTHRLLQLPDPAERWHHASRPHHGVRAATHRDAEKTRSAVVVISSLFFTLTVISTLALGIFCRKRNTVFVLQKCEQRDYAVAAADDDDDDVDVDELSTDCDSSTLPTNASRPEVDRRTSQRCRRLHRAGDAPTTPDLSLFCTSQTGNRNRTGSGSTMLRDKMSRRSAVAAEVRSSWIELDPAATLSTTLPVECTDNDTDDDVRCRVTRDVMSASSLLRCSSSGLVDGDAGMFQRSTSLDGDVCRFALTCGTASSQPLMMRPREPRDPRPSTDCSTPSPCRELAASDVTDASNTPSRRGTSTPQQSLPIGDVVHYHACETGNETFSTAGFNG